MLPIKSLKNFITSIYGKLKSALFKFLNNILLRINLFFRKIKSINLKKLNPFKLIVSQKTKKELEKDSPPMCAGDPPQTITGIGDATGVCRKSGGFRTSRSQPPRGRPGDFLRILKEKP